MGENKPNNDNLSNCPPLPTRMTIEYLNQFIVKLSGKIMYLRDLSENKFMDLNRYVDIFFLLPKCTADYAFYFTIISYIIEIIS